MNQSHSFGNQLSRYNLAIHGAQHNAAHLAKDASVAAIALQGMVDNLIDLNARQEQAKQALAALTAQIEAKLAAGRTERAKIISYAEAAFGKAGSKLREFRPATEGKVHRRKTNSEKQAAALKAAA